MNVFTSIFSNHSLHEQRLLLKVVRHRCNVIWAIAGIAESQPESPLKQRVNDFSSFRATDYYIARENVLLAYRAEFFDLVSLAMHDCCHRSNCSDPLGTNLTQAYKPRDNLSKYSSHLIAIDYNSLTLECVTKSGFFTRVNGGLLRLSSLLLNLLYCLIISHQVLVFPAEREADSSAFVFGMISTCR